MDCFARNDGIPVALDKHVLAKAGMLLQHSDIPVGADIVRDIQLHYHRLYQVTYGTADANIP